MSKHTPWRYGEQYADNGETEWIAIVDDEGNLIAKHIEEQTAEHIVKCVNEHEALKAQVRELVEALEKSKRHFNEIGRWDLELDIQQVLAKHTTKESE